MKRTFARWSIAALLAASALVPADTSAQVNSTEGNALIFQVQGVERARISDTVGNVGIGNTNPLAKLSVNGTISATDAVQIGTSILACTTPVSGSVRYNIASDTLQVCTGSGWKSLSSATTVGNATTASSTGAIQFNSNNQLAGDTTNLFWDDANNRLGIGTNAPAVRLEVSGSEGLRLSQQGGVNNPYIAWHRSGVRQAYMGWGAPGSDFQITTENGNRLSLLASTTYASGNVGIGTTSPAATLDVSGSARVFKYANTAAYSDGLLFLVGNNASGSNYSRLMMGQVSTNNMFIESANQDNVKGNLLLQPYGGNVGIGTTNSNAKLDVYGVISGTTFNAANADTAAAPGYTWSTDTNTGMYHPSSDVIGWSIGGTEKMRLGVSGLGINAAPTTQVLYLVTTTTVAGSYNGIYGAFAHTPGTAPNGIASRGVYVTNDYASANTATNSGMRGGEFYARKTGSGSISNTYGVLGYAQGFGGGTMHTGAGLYGFTSVSDSTTATSLYGGLLYTYDYNGVGVGGVTNAYGA